MGAVAVPASEKVTRLNHAIMDIEDRDRFHLDPTFLDQFRDKQPEWGPVGYATYKRTYARPVEVTDQVEEFWQTCQRVVQGVYTVQKWHCRKNNLHWRDGKAQRSAQNVPAHVGVQVPPRWSRPLDDGHHLRRGAWKRGAQQLRVLHDRQHRQGLRRTLHVPHGLLHVGCGRRWRLPRARARSRSSAPSRATTFTSSRTPAKGGSSLLVGT